MPLVETKVSVEPGHGLLGTKLVTKGAGIKILTLVIATPPASPFCILYVKVDSVSVVYI